VLVPKSSSIPVAVWAWPTRVVSRRRVLEVVFVLLESPSPSTRNFIGSYSLPPLWFAISVLHHTTALHVVSCCEFAFSLFVIQLLNLGPVMISIIMG
jgi:hypothetical protein